MNKSKKFKIKKSQEESHEVVVFFSFLFFSVVWNSSLLWVFFRPFGLFFSKGAVVVVYQKN